MRRFATLWFWSAAKSISENPDLCAFRQGWPEGRFLFVAELQGKKTLTLQTGPETRTPDAHTLLSSEDLFARDWGVEPKPKTEQ